MPNAALTWQQAGVLALVLLILAAVLARLARCAPAAPFVRETGVIAGLYALWQFVMSR